MYQFRIGCFQSPLVRVIHHATKITFFQNSILLKGGCLVTMNPRERWISMGEMDKPHRAFYLVGNTMWMGFPDGTGGKKPTCQCRRCKRLGFNPWVGKIPWRRAWQLTPVFLPGESHGQRTLAGYSPWGRKKLNTTEATEHTHVHKDATWTSTQPTSPSLPCSSFRGWDVKEADLLVFSCTSTPYIWLLPNSKSSLLLLSGWRTLVS